MPPMRIYPLFVFIALFLVACSSPYGKQARGAQAAQLPTRTISSVGQDDQFSTTLLTKASKAATTGRSSALPENPLETCLVTQPPDPSFVPPPPSPEIAPNEGLFWYGTQDLWTSLPIDGTWQQLAHGEKVFWWRKGYDGSEEPQPELAMTGRRLDAPAPVAHSRPPATNAYHRDFHWAMLHGFTVATPGCWEITGSYEDHELSFVVWVAP